MKIKLWKKFIIKSKYEQTHTFHMAGSCIVCLSCSVGSNSATPWTVDSQALLPMGFSRQEYWMCCHFLLQGNFPTQELNSSLPHCKWILYHLSHKAFDKSQGHGISTCSWVRTTLQVWTYSCLTTKFSKRVRVRGGETRASKCVSTTPESAPHSAALLRICRFLGKKKKEYVDSWMDPDLLNQVIESRGPEINTVETPLMAVMPPNCETLWSRKGCVSVASQELSFILSSLLDRKSSLFVSYVAPELTQCCEN